MRDNSVHTFFFLLHNKSLGHKLRTLKIISYIFHIATKLIYSWSCHGSKISESLHLNNFYRTEQLIKQAIQENDFLNNMMDNERLQAVINAMSSEELPIGTFLITEGQTGSHFYVSESGTFEVIKDGRVLKTFGKGVVFGELAILYKAKRFASIKGWYIIH